ncbi:MAG: peptidoglycan binding domain-containing protein, partial [bacterium]|nr:peptidoglycan binding domain-containing protein [bacterium]
MKLLLRLCSLTTFLAIIFFSTLFAAYEIAYRDRIYPGVFVDKTDFSNRTKQELGDYLKLQNSFVGETVFDFVYKDKKWSASSKDLGWEIDSGATADSVFALGRSRHFLANFAFKIKIWFKPVNIDPFFRFDRKKVDDFLRPIAAETDELPIDALFQFKGNRVVSFRVSKQGKKLNREAAIALI